MAEFISLREYARRRRCALRAVQRAIESGRITEPAIRRQGQRVTGVDPHQADIDWATRTDPVQAARHGKLNLLPEVAGSAAPPAMSSAAPSSEGAGPGGQGTTAAPSRDERGEDYHEHRATREKAEAALANLRLQEKLGQLCSVVEVRKAQFEAARLVQTAMLRLPGRLAAMLAAEADPVKVEALLDREIRRELDGLADRAAERAAA